MSIGKWLRDSKYTAEQYRIAVNLLSTGGTPPSFRAIRKTLGRLRRGDKEFGMGHGWRRSPRIA